MGRYVALAKWCTNPQTQYISFAPRNAVAKRELYLHILNIMRLEYQGESRDQK
jgi:hypothetical protein